mmetsp:Transcript_29385/g.85455  ORF Transcript_29385/g.85455 Transcript_29385/m.85455 type:complete len:200 (-) Transcript_29385:150-749(-)
MTDLQKSGSNTENAVQDPQFTVEGFLEGLEIEEKKVNDTLDGIKATLEQEGTKIHTKVMTKVEEEHDKTRAELAKLTKTRSLASSSRMLRVSSLPRTRAARVSTTFSAWLPASAMTPLLWSPSSPPSSTGTRTTEAPTRSSTSSRTSSRISFCPTTTKPEASSRASAVASTRRPTTTPSPRWPSYSHVNVVFGRSNLLR